MNVSQLRGFGLPGIDDHHLAVGIPVDFLEELPSLRDTMRLPGVRAQKQNEIGVFYVVGRVT